MMGQSVLFGMGWAATLLFGVMMVGVGCWFGYEIWTWWQKRRRKEATLRHLGRIIEQREKQMMFGQRYGVGKNMKTYFGEQGRGINIAENRQGIDDTMARIEHELAWRRQWGLD